MAGVSPLPRSWSPSQITARQRKVIDLLANGVRAADIARELGGITENGVRKLMRRALSAQAAHLMSKEAHQAAAALYMHRHDLLMERWFPKALAGDKDAADVSLRLMKMFADVYGLNAPIKIDPSGTGSEGGTPVTPATLIAAIAERLDEVAHRMQPPAIEGETVDEDLDAPAGDEAKT